MFGFLRHHIIYSLLAVIFTLSLVLDHAQPATAQEPEVAVQWDPSVQIPSPPESRSWFPDLAVDSQGHVHVVWNETKAFDPEKDKDSYYSRWEGGEIERVFYSKWDGQKWSPFNDIVPPQPDIIRNGIVIDNKDKLHFVFGWLQLFYKQTQASEAFSAAAWSLPRQVNSRNGTYLSDIAVYEDTIHIVYDDVGTSEESDCKAGCADIFYRKSTGGGLSWQAPIALFPTGAGSARSQIELDKAGVIHVTWDEGWDRLSGTGEAESGVYMFSLDQGESWSEPLIVTYPNSNNAQLTPGSSGEGGVMLVWRTHSPDYPGIYYMWSADQGESWSPPRTIPQILSRGDAAVFDMYDMATDSAGNIHLVVSGYLPDRKANGDPPGIYHLIWDGKQWSAPVALYDAGWLPEYPHIVVHQGNQLHATWFIREDAFNPTKPNQVWYTHGWTDAPEIKGVQPTVTPIPTPIPLPPTPT